MFRCRIFFFIFFFFFKQKTAYEMRISDWSSDVCSSDLIVDIVAQQGHLRPSIYPLGPEFGLASWASMTSIATVEEARRYIDRLAKVSAALNGVQLSLTEGRERGIRYPKLVVERAIGVVKGQASVDVEANSFFGPLKVLATRGVAFAGIVEEGRQAVARVVAPALMNYADRKSTRLNSRH